MKHNYLLSTSYFSCSIESSHLLQYQGIKEVQESQESHEVLWHILHD